MIPNPGIARTTSIRHSDFVIPSAFVIRHSSLVSDSLGDPHEHVFEVDLFFLEHLEAAAVFDKDVGDIRCSIQHPEFSKMF